MKTKTRYCYVCCEEKILHFCVYEKYYHQLENYGENQGEIESQKFKTQSRKNYLPTVVLLEEEVRGFHLVQY
jgi:hypothetical protein